MGYHRRSAARPRPIERLDAKTDKPDRLWLNSGTGERSSSDLFDRVFARALRDLRVLPSRMGREHYFAAGVPWFATLFGRDAALVAIQTLPYGSTVARGIRDSPRARTVASRLLEADMFSGWGIRTLSARERAYNPVSYHRGSVWPHDNGLILAGFRRYGIDRAAVHVFDACWTRRSSSEDGCRSSSAASRGGAMNRRCRIRPPRRRRWAAGALPHGLWNLLGLRPNPMERRLRVVRPVLPDRLEWLHLSALRVGDAVVNLRFEPGDGDRPRVNAEVKQGRIDVEVVETMRPPDAWVDDFRMSPDLMFNGIAALPLGTDGPVATVRVRRHRGHHAARR